MQFHNQYRLKNWEKKCKSAWKPPSPQSGEKASLLYFLKEVITDKVRTRTDAAAMSMLCNSASFKYSDILILSRWCAVCMWQYFRVTTCWQTET